MNMQLTALEQQYLLLRCQGLTQPQVAERMFRSIRTLDGYRDKILEKTGAKNLLHALATLLLNDIVKTKHERLVDLMRLQTSEAIHHEERDMASEFGLHLLSERLLQQHSESEQAHHLTYAHHPQQRLTLKAFFLKPDSIFLQHFQNIQQHEAFRRHYDLPTPHPGFLPGKKG